MSQKTWWHVSATLAQREQKKDGCSNYCSRLFFYIGNLEEQQAMSKHPYYSQKDIQKYAKNNEEKRLRDPVRKQQEREFAEKYAYATDRELYDYVKSFKKSSKKHLRGVTLMGYVYLIKRLGPWQNIMVKVNQELEEEKMARKNALSKSEETNHEKTGRLR